MATYFLHAGRVTTVALTGGAGMGDYLLLQVLPDQSAWLTAHEARELAAKLIEMANRLPTTKVADMFQLSLEEQSTEK